MKKMFLFALVMALLITSCGQKQKGSNTLIRPVKTAQVSSQSVIRKDFSGIVEAVEYVRLAFRVSGQIISLPVVEGQRVKKGQLMPPSTHATSPCNMQPTRLPTKQLPHKWNVTNGCLAARLSPCRNTKSA